MDLAILDKLKIDIYIVSKNMICIVLAKNLRDKRVKCAILSDLDLPLWSLYESRSREVEMSRTTQPQPSQSGLTGPLISATVPAFVSKCTLFAGS